MEKIKKTAAYCSESLDKVRASEWSEPVATALKVTGNILSGIGHFVPGVGIVGGAFKIGSDILNPKVNSTTVSQNQNYVTIKKIIIIKYNF